MSVPTEINIDIRRGDTKTHVFLIKDAAGVVVDVSGWTAIVLAINSEKKPIDISTEIDTIAGAFVTDGTDGRIGFQPTGMNAIGKYFYDAQALNAAAEKMTFVWGTYTISQDISKD